MSFSRWHRMPIVSRAAFFCLTGFCLAGLCVAPVASQEASPVGNWKGSLEVPGGRIPLVFHIAEGDDGHTATMDSPDQGALGIPVDTVTWDNGRLELHINAIGGGFAGDLQEDGTIDGKWSQAGNELPLSLEPSDESAERRRPQNPEPPFPYDVEDVTIETPTEGVTLAGTLTVPRSGSPHPAVVLISGSGPQDRDESLMGHRPFFVLADYLTRRGIAVLRYDERGIGESTGVFETATSVDFAVDTGAAVDFLQTRTDVDEIGLVGHSEGGIVAPMVANATGDIAFVVLMAGPGVSGEEILYQQGELIILANGGSQALADANRRNQEAIFAAIKSTDDPDAARKELRSTIEAAIRQVSPGADPEVVSAQVDAQLQQLLSPWFRYFLVYDPAPALAALEVPVLAINGEKDTQVPPSENLEAMRTIFEASGHEDFELVELAGLNHLFQTAETGSPLEYAQIEETFATRALDTIGDWIVARLEGADR